MKFIYIHGLNGSSDSVVGQQLKKSIPDIIIPDLPNNPIEWYNSIHSLFVNKEDVTIIGNSTGALIANYIGQHHGFNVVLINPVVDVYDLLQFVGTNINRKTNEKWELTNDDIRSLKKFEITKTVSPTLIFLGSNDSILNPTKTINMYKWCCEIITTPQEHLYILSDKEIEMIKEMEFIIPL